MGTKEDIRTEEQISFALPVTVSNYNTEELDCFMFGIRQMEEKLSFAKERIQTEIERR